MSRYADSTDDTVRQRSGWLIPLGVFLVTFALSAMFLLFYLAPTPPSFFEEQVNATARTDVIDIKIAGHKFHIPANYFEYRSARQGGDRKDVALFALLPDMEGYSNWEDSVFKSNTVDSPIVYLLLRDDDANLTEADKLQRIYMVYVANPKGSEGPFGLTQYIFRDDSGYRHEDLFVGQTATGPAVIRCVRFSQEVPSPSCIRDVPVAHNVALSYRFKRAQLSRWQQIGDGIDKLMVLFRTKPAK